MSKETGLKVLELMDNIEYGWIDINGKKHIRNMEGFRKLYRTMSIEDTLNNKLGTCIEQVRLMKRYLDDMNMPNKMFCTRIYEGNEDIHEDEEEHMHCFILYYEDNKVYQIEHPNFERIGVYEFDNEDEAINSINEHYINLSGGVSRPVTEFYDVEPNLSFKDFNLYINSLDKQKKM